MGLPAVVSDLLFCCRLMAASCLQDKKKVAARMGNLPKRKTGLKPVTF